VLRLLHTADVHLGLTKFGGAYDASDDTAVVLDSFASVALEHQVDVAIIVGDLFHTRRPEPRHLFAAVRAIRRMAGNDVLVIITSGNHDGPSNVDRDEPGDHTLAWLAAADIENVLVFTHPVSVQLTTATKKPFSLVSVPYPHKRRFDAELFDLPVGERVSAASGRLAAEVAELSARTHEDLGPRLFAGHLTVEGAITGTEREMQLGWDVTLPASSLVPFSYAALGHIHRQQEVTAGAWYAGAPSYVSFAEEGQEKSFLLADIENDTVDVSRIASGARLIQTDPDEVAPGAVLRVHAEPDESPLALNERLRALREAGASYIDVVYPPLERPEREEVDPALDLRDLLTERLDQRKLPHEPYLSVAQEVIDAC
jgi:exonuclease SbcD